MLVIEIRGRSRGAARGDSDRAAPPASAAKKALLGRSGRGAHDPAVRHEDVRSVDAAHGNKPKGPTRDPAPEGHVNHVLPISRRFASSNSAAVRTPF